jgi:hypothetical protein
MLEMKNGRHSLGGKEGPGFFEKIYGCKSFLIGNLEPLKILDKK